MRGRIAPLLACVVAIAVGAMLLAGCGSSGDGESRPAPAASEFPAAKGRSLAEIAQLPEAKLVVAPAGQVVDVGVNRLAFGVFTLGGEQVDDADIALYFAHGPNGPAQGPFPARVESLKTPAAFRAKTTSQDPSAATSVYVVPGVKVKQPGELAMLALIRRDGKLEGTRPPSLVAGKYEDIPNVGDEAPRIHTPTADEVRDISEIDTRIPPDSMHDVDFAEVLGKKPILLVFATPQLCQSRVCGPVVDIEEEVKSRIGDEAAFIHMEVYNDNEISEGVRKQLREFNLETEPWAFVVDRNGRIAARFEGAFGAEELTQALEATIKQPAS
ncbi:MAG TPA: thioredoxin family protein [Solirubrobacterales bacterium]|nr:thioredoxin family protein [Solirubrobacterales bacterium]